MSFWHQEVYRRSEKSNFTPGDREKYQPFLGQPYPVDNPHVFFAGEHLAINHASVQGAVQTSVSAVIDLLERLT